MKHLTLVEIEQELGVSRHVAQRLRKQYAPKNVDRLRSRTTYIKKLVNRALYHGEHNPALTRWREAYKRERS